MNKCIVFLGFCLTAFLTTVRAQDNIDDMRIYPIEHATFTIEWKGKTLLFDPSTDKEKLKKLKSPDLILITDIHGDHFNLSSLKKYRSY